MQCSTEVGSAVSNGGAEAYIELQKALNIVGDYRLSTSCNSVRWGLPPFQNAAASAPLDTIGDAASVLISNLSEYDFGASIVSIGLNGNPVVAAEERADAAAGAAFSASSVGSACFAMATSLETTNGVEISGLNAEEQSDIALLAQWNVPQAQNFSLEVYTYYDAMIILRENNVLELIQ